MEFTGNSSTFLLCLYAWLQRVHRNLIKVLESLIKYKLELGWKNSMKSADDFNFAALKGQFSPS